MAQNNYKNTKTKKKYLLVDNSNTLNTKQLGILYVFFWVFPRRQIVISRRFGTLCQFYLQRLGVEYWELTIRINL
jgi:hypothetical protein